MRLRNGLGGQHAEIFPFVVEYELTRMNAWQSPAGAEGYRSLTTAEFMERHRWCHDNCTSEHTIYYKRAGFQCEQDALLFMMRW